MVAVLGVQPHRSAEASAEAMPCLRQEGGLGDTDEYRFCEYRSIDSASEADYDSGQVKNWLLRGRDTRMSDGWDGFVSGPAPMEVWLDEEQRRVSTSSVFYRLYCQKLHLRSPPRYVVRSRPKPHKWAFADAKAVMRRLRRGRSVSARLVRRAMRTYWDEAKQAGSDEARED